MVSAIKTMPVSNVIQTLRQVLKSPPIVSGTQINVEVAVLQFFYAYLAKCSVSQVMDLWSDLAGLLRECLVLAPPAIFLALAILNQFTTRAPTLSERKDQKELQELAGKLVDSCAQVILNMYLYIQAKISYPKLGVKRGGGQFFQHPESTTVLPTLW